MVTMTIEKLRTIKQVSIILQVDRDHLGTCLAFNLEWNAVTENHIKCFQHNLYFFIRYTLKWDGLLKTKTPSDFWDAIRINDLHTRMQVVNCMNLTQRLDDDYLPSPFVGDKPTVSKPRWVDRLLSVLCWSY